MITLDSEIQNDKQRSVVSEALAKDPSLHKSSLVGTRFYYGAFSLWFPRMRARARIRSDPGQIRTYRGGNLNPVSERELQSANYRCNKLSSDSQRR